jgi:Hypothetical glycosyl hydrolase family 15
LLPRVSTPEWWWSRACTLSLVALTKFHRAAIIGLVFLGVIGTVCFGFLDGRLANTGSPSWSNLGASAHGRLANSGSPNWSHLEVSARRNNVWITNPWWVDKARRIHATNPNAKVLAYHNAIACKDDDAVADDGSGRRYVAAGVLCSEAAERHPTTGHGGPDDWYLHDASGQHVLTNWGQPHMNPANAGYQAAWRERVARQVRDGGFDGVFVDDANVRCNCASAPTEYPTDADLQNAMRAFLDGVVPYLKSTGVPYVLGNIGSWTSNPAAASSYIERMDGGFEEHFSVFGTFDQARQQVEDAQHNGKWFYGAIGTGEEGATEQQLRYGQGIVLLFTVGRSVVGSRDPTNEQWIAAYDQADQLGKPTAAATQLADGQWQRSFENGHVIVNPSTRDAAITLNL